MLGALGATDRNVRLVVRANGVVVGVVGALGGLVVGLAAWLAYRPKAEQSAHHLIGAFALPWVVIGPALGLAVLATFFAASRPARAITRMSTVAALSGRPAPPKQVHRSALPGVVFAVIAVLALWYSGTSDNNGGGAPELVGGLVCLTVAVILLSPLFLAAMARAAKATPIAARLALRDLGRYRARSGSALAAIALGVMIAMLVCVLSAARYGNVLDYAGPNLTSSQLIVYTPSASAPAARRPRQATATATARDCATAAARSPRRPPRPASAPRSARGTSSRWRPRAPGCSTPPPARSVRPGVRRHPAAAGRLRDQGLPGQPGRRHPVHAARPVRPRP